MKKVKIITAIILVCAFFFGFGFYVGRLQKATPVKPKNDVDLPFVSQKRAITINDVKAKLAELQELSTYSGEYTVKRTEENVRYFLDKISIPGSKNKISFTCKGIVKVGYDINTITTQVDSKSGIIYISLPKPTLLDNYIVWDSINCNEQNSILNPIDFEQYRAMATDIESEGLKQTEGQGIYQKAEAHMKTIIEAFLSEFPDYDLKFM